ncbi:afg1 family protein [Cystoisospora suis]|uniref:Afg1 family protein n=1 Tax=Cystoisospora suis TaxID=483139 RepID=A0A2C6KRU0_9APIC|nr:afg1 family protein [Cystoisospora suis]
MQNFDEEQPTEKNEFLFSKAEDLSGKKKDRMSQPVSTPYELFNEGGSSGAQDNKFAYIRTISRIRDMASTSYLEAHQKQHKLNDLKFFGVC